MPAEFDLSSAAAGVARLLPAIEDTQLTDPTPCPDFTVGDLLDHLLGLAGEFRDAATKQTVVRAAAGEPAGKGGQGSAEHLHPGWRTELPSRLSDLAAAWRDPAAWDGMTMAGGLDLPSGIAALVTVDELVMHGWDLAKGTGQELVVDEESLQACYRFTELTAAEGPEARAGLFGPIVAVPDDAPLLHRALGLAGRDPDWRP